MTRRAGCAFVLALACSALGAQSDVASDDGAIGTWNGDVHSGGTPKRLRLCIEQGGRARFTLPHFGWYGLPAAVTGGEGRLRIELAVGEESARIDLMGTGEERRGRWQGFGTGAKVRLVRTSAAPDGFETRTVSFARGTRRFEATLVLPAGDGPFPALVWAHGPEAPTREDALYRSFALWGVEHGIAALLFEEADGRPETGETSFDDLADDTLAALRAIADDARLRTDALGVAGHGRGGWIAAHAAGRGVDVAFCLGLGVTSGRPTEELDPRALWGRIRVPLAVTWGAEDEHVAARKSLDTVRTSYAAPEGTKRLLTLLPGADHALRLPAEAPWTMRPLHPDLIEHARFLRSL